MNRIILLNKRPVGKPTLGDFKFTTEALPEAGDGELLLKTCYVSVDPYLRGRMNDSRSYVPAFKLNTPIRSFILAEVTKSNNADFKRGDFVTGNLDWKEYQLSSGKDVTIVDAKASKLSTYMGVLGMTGLAAYIGLTEIGMPKSGESLVVSGAGGAVGTVVGQVGKLLGCRIVGITGTDNKVELLKSKFGFDDAINYKTNSNLNEAIKKACPNGVDIYFDNVGGEISDAVLLNINKYARIPLCGTISLYNNTEIPIGPRIQPLLLTKSATMSGFIVGDFSGKFQNATKQLATWLKEGKITYTETIVKGFDNIPQAFLGLFEGKNEGKMIVEI